MSDKASTAPAAGSALHTPGPWRWRRMGEWVLAGDHGMRPIVLSVRTHGPMKERGFTSRVDGLLRPFDPAHPDAKLIAAAPALADALRGLIVLAEAALNLLRDDGDPDDIEAAEEDLIIARTVLRAAGREMSAANAPEAHPGAVSQDLTNSAAAQGEEK